MFSVKWCGGSPPTRAALKILSPCWHVCVGSRLYFEIAITALCERQNTTHESCSVNNARQMYVSHFSAERYDPLTSTWTSIAAMSTRRRYVRVATLGTDYFLSITVSRFCFAAHVQQTRGITNCICLLMFAPLAVCFAYSWPDGNLYAVGGYDSSSHLATVEKYDPQVNKHAVWDAVRERPPRRQVQSRSLIS